MFLDKFDVLMSKIIQFTIFTKIIYNYIYIYIYYFNVISQVKSNMKSLVTKHPKLFFFQPPTQPQF